MSKVLQGTTDANEEPEFLRVVIKVPFLGKKKPFLETLLLRVYTSYVLTLTLVLFLCAFRPFRLCIGSF